MAREEKTNQLVCGCNAMPIPHIHDVNSIREATAEEKQAITKGVNAPPRPGRFDTPVS